MSIVVSDTSPIRALHHVGQLPLLATLYGRVIVPPTVRWELRSPKPPFLSIEVEQFPFLEVVIPTRHDDVKEFQKSLDPGESEALA